MKTMTLSLCSLIGLATVSLVGCSAERGDDPVGHDESAIETDHRYKPRSAGLHLTNRFIYALLTNNVTKKTEVWRRPYDSEQWQTVARDVHDIVAAGDVVAFWKTGSISQGRCVASPLLVLKDDAASPTSIDVGGCVQEAAVDARRGRFVTRVITEARASLVTEVGTIRMVSFDGTTREDVPNLGPSGEAQRIQVVDGTVYAYVTASGIRGGLARLDPVTKRFEHYKVRCNEGDGFAHMCQRDDGGVDWRYTAGPVHAADGPDALYTFGPVRLARIAGSPYYDATSFSPSVRSRSHSGHDLWHSHFEGGKAYLARYDSNFVDALNIGVYALARIDLARSIAVDVRNPVDYIDDHPWIRRFADSDSGGAVADIDLRDGKFYILRYADARDGYPVVEVVSADAPSLPRENPGPQGLQPPPPCCGG